MNQEEVFATFKSVFEEIVPDVDARQITLEHSMRDLGANSIDRAEILTETMEKLDIALPMVSFGSARNIGEIVAIMSGEVRA